MSFDINHFEVYGYFLQETVKYSKIQITNIRIIEIRYYSVP